MSTAPTEAVLIRSAYFRCMCVEKSEFMFVLVPFDVKVRSVIKFLMQEKLHHRNI